MNMTKEPYKPVWFILFMVAGLAAVVGMSRLFQPREIIPWRTDFAAARQESRQSNRPILLYFTAPWCQPCQILRRTTWADQNVNEALSAYVPVKVDIDRNSDLAIQYGASSIPAYAILDDQGNSTKAIAGYLAPEAFLEWLKGLNIIEGA